MKKALSVLMFFLSFSLVSFCQKDLRAGYIINLNNDTIKGLIDLRNNTFDAKKCIFYDNPDSQGKEYLPGEIKAYRINDSKYFVTREVKTGETKNTVFLEYLVNGITSLYYLKDENGDHFYIEKGADVYELTNNVSIVGEGDDKFYKESNFYKGMLSVVYSDAKQLQPAITSARFDRKSMMKLSEDYHNLVCTDRSCIIYEKDKKGVEFSIGPAVRYEWYRAKYQEYLSSFTYDETGTILIGASMNLRLISINEKMNLGFKTLLGRDHSIGYRTITSLGRVETTQIDFRKGKLTNEIDLVYKYPTGKFRPVAGLGLHLSFFLNNNTVIRNTIYDNSGNIMHYDEKVDAIEQFYDVALNLMAGFSQSVGKHSVFFEVYYNLGGQQYLETGTTNEHLKVSRYGKISAFGLTSGFMF
jgi:hypothetical protein